MNLYPTDPEPRSVEEHNRRMNETMVKYAVPRLLVCPDCYLPARLCNHLREQDLSCYFHPWPGE